MLSLENVDPSLGGLSEGVALQRGGTEEGEGPSFPTLSCLVEPPLVGGLAEAPEWKAGPQEVEASPAA